MAQDDPVTVTRRPATLADVGRRAGVSAMAASAVLNGSGKSVRLAADTVERIKTAARELGYKPNAVARALLTQRIHVIGVVTRFEDGELNQYAIEVLQGILEAAARRKQNTTVFAVDDWSTGSDEIRRFCDNRIDGLILIAPLLQRQELASLAARMPVVSLHANEPSAGIINLEPDEEEGAFQATSLLLELGHRRILHMAGPRRFLGAQRRIQGWRRALAQRGMEPGDEDLVPAGFDGPSGRTAFLAWIEQHRGDSYPDAVFCANDAVAIAIMDVLLELGVQVPGQISVIGFDDTVVARTCRPQLTTVRQPLRRMGSLAVDGLMQLLDAASDVPVLPPPLPATVVVRDSTGVRAGTAPRIPRCGARP